MGSGAVCTSWQSAGAKEPSASLLGRSRPKRKLPERLSALLASNDKGSKNV